MKQLFFFFLLALPLCMTAQNVGIGTNTPQAKLDVNGTFRLENGVIVNGISADSTLSPGSDSLLPTQGAVKRYLERALFAGIEESTDSLFVLRDTAMAAAHVMSMYATDEFAYVGVYQQGLFVYDISNPDSIYRRGQISDFIISPRGLIVKDNIAYVINHMGGPNQFRIYDVSDPDHPVALGGIGTNMYFPLGLSVVGDYAYVACSGNNRFCVIDVSNPSAPVAKGFVSPGGLAVMDVFVRDQKAYLVSWDNILWIYDVSDPNSLVFMDSITTFMQYPERIKVSGDYAYVTSWSNNRLCIYDISDPHHIEAVSWISEGIGGPENIIVRGSNVFVSNSTINSLSVFDVSNPAQPKLWSSKPWPFPPTCRTEMAGRFFCASSEDIPGFGLMEWTDAGNERVLTMTEDSSLIFRDADWQSNEYNVFRLLGNVGIGTSTPSAPLHIDGNMKIEKHSTLEFGAGIAGKHQDAGKIGYGTFSGNALDIVGAGALNSRKIRLYAEAGTELLGSLFVHDTTHLHKAFVATDLNVHGNIVVENGNVAIGTSSAAYRLDVNGRMRLRHSNGTAGCYYNNSANTEAAFIGMKNDSEIGMYGSASNLWSILMNTTTGNVGISSNLFVNGFAGLGTTTPEFRLDVKGRMALRADVENGYSAGVFLSNMSDHEVAFLGMFVDTLAGMFNPTTANWPLLMNTGTGNIGIGGVNPLQKLHVYGNQVITNGYLGIGTTSPGAALHIVGNQKIEGTHGLEFGAGVSGKHVDAGKITYQQFSGDALDIVGAGTSAANRKVRIYAEGGLYTAGPLEVSGVMHAAGPLNVSGTLTANTIASEAWTELSGSLQNGWINYEAGYATVAMYKDPLGVVHLRGLIKNGSTTPYTVIMQLPVGYRPIYGHMTFSVINGDTTIGRIIVQWNGEVLFVGNSNAFLSLDEVSFRAW